MIFPEYVPVLDVYRSGYIDNRFFGLIFLYDKNGLIKKIGNDNNAKFYLRSLFKPIQASILDKNIIKTFDFNEMELAIMQGSHAGEPIHIKLIQSILNKINMSEKDLLCPLIEPLNTKIYKNSENFSKLHNNCSGKHAMVLSFCKFHGFDTKNYTDLSHPVQQKIKETLLKYAGTNDCITTTDGCTMPVYGLKIDNIARAFLNFYKDENNKILIDSYRKNPYIIGGSDNSGKRTDTKIMELSDNLISKVGAGGFIYVYNMQNEQILIIKMAQNNNKEREILTLEILYRLNWLDKTYYDDKIYTEDNKPVGNYKVCKF